MSMKLHLSPRAAALIGALTAAVLLILGLTGIVYGIAGDARGLTKEMQRFAPPAATGLPEEMYPEMGRHLADYLTGKKESFQFPLADGDEGELFHDNELAHMADCRALLGLDGTVCFCAAVLAAMGLLLLSALAREGRADFARGGCRALLILAAAGAMLAVWALVNFDGFFITFHRLAFRNDLWLLDPRTDLLIRLMPEAFFVDLGLRGLIVAILWVLLLALGFLRLRRKNGAAAPDAAGRRPDGTRRAESRPAGFNPPPKGY